MGAPSLSLCMIARDEEKNLPRCLSSVSGLVEQIIMVDTGSTDGTVQVAKRFGAEVVSFPWTNSFSEARNRALELARGDWVLILDADDELVREDIPLLRELLASPYEAYFLQTINVLGVNSPEGGMRHPNLRLFRNRAEYRYAGRIHETVIPSIVRRAGREGIRVAGVRVRHYGYLKQAVEEKDKARRNLVLLQKELASRPPDSFLHYNLAVEYLRLGENARALEHFTLAEEDVNWKADYAPSLARKKADCLALLGQKREAIAYLERLTAIYPDYTDLYYQQGFLLAEEGDFPRAIQAFERCLAMGDAPAHYPAEEGAGSALAWRALGNVYEVMLEKERALEAYRREAACNPRDLWPLGRIIAILLERGTEEEALAYLDAYFNLVTPVAYLGVASIFLSHCRPRPARRFLAEAARLGASGDAYHVLRAECLLLEGQREEAGAILQEVPPSSPHRLRAWKDAFLLRCLCRDLVGAESLLAEDIPAPLREACLLVWQALRGVSPPRETGPVEPELQQLLVEFWEKAICAGDHGLAEAILSLARAPELALALGKACFRRGREVEGEQLLEQALREGAQDAEAARFLARVRAGRHDWEAAASLCARALDWDPGDWETCLELARLYREEALTVLQGLPELEKAVAALAGRDQPRLSLCMIVRDEEEYLPRCLASVREVVDEIIVVDTGSTDRTVAIAQGCGARVYHYPWGGDFSAARNFSLEKAGGDWILVLDPDQEIHPGDGAKIRALTTAGDAEAFCFQMINYYGAQPGDDYMTDLCCLMFRNRPAYRFRRALHEQVVDQVIAARGPAAVKIANVRVLHYGYLTPVAQKKNKAARNLEIIRRVLEREPENTFLRYSLGVELLNRGDYAGALAQLQMSYRPGLSYSSDVALKMAVCLKELRRYPEAVQWLEQSINIYPGFTDLYHLLGEVFLDQAAYRQAVEAFQRCIKMGDAPVHYCGSFGAGGFRAWYGLGRAYEGLGERQEAIHAYRQAVQANPRFHQPLYPLARLLRAEHGPAGAAGELERFFDLADPAGLLLLADLQLGCGDYQRALAYLDRSETGTEESGPARGRRHYMRGLCLAHLGCGAEAEECWRRVPPRSQYHVPALTWRFLLALQAGDAERAAALAAELATVEPATGQAYEAVARIARDPAGPPPAPVEGLRETLADLARRCASLGDAETAGRLSRLLENLPSATEHEPIREGSSCS